MRNLAVLGGFAFALAACGSGAAGGVANAVVTDGQLFCSTSGTLAATFALVNPSGAAVLAEGQSEAYVKAACALIDALPVSPPAAGTVVPKATVAVPTAS